jgi:NTE family protein
MNTTPSSTLHVTSTWSPESTPPLTADGFTVAPIGAPRHGNRPRSDQQADAARRSRAVGERALVLGGGGSAGNAWEIGVIAGLFDARLDVTKADLIIGTSAGSTAAAQITSAPQPTELLANILAATPQPRTGADRRHDLNKLAAHHLEKTSEIIRAAEDPADMRRRMGAAALEMASDSSAQTQRRATVAARLPSQHWPQQPILIVAVDAHTGEPIVFDRHSGVDLADAVTASCAGPGGPPHSIGDNRYIDGGYRSNENADLATGYGRVLVLSPLGGRSRAPQHWGTHLAAQVDELRAHGSRVETILPDSNSRNAFGANLMDPSTRPPAAQAGYHQGRALAEQLTEFWR